ncbi:hypothetical protein DQ04_03081050 [Trypanosoma grayi]|uniref:hypothetical protein n=1 Tax=Trypanosoma grayi TaxID=71804 RepID=UPI0004F3FEA2|nr:hypothetical protein DQ04_03081050 [Trypanosoma grayi]KEG10989.1 hypothetical protein DQ04_03081050 [Trypanosoma grayi]
MRYVSRNVALSFAPRCALCFFFCFTFFPRWVEGQGTRVQQPVTRTDTRARSQNFAHSRMGSLCVGVEEDAVPLGRLLPVFILDAWLSSFTRYPRKRGRIRHAALSFPLLPGVEMGMLLAMTM